MYFALLISWICIGKTWSIMYGSLNSKREFSNNVYKWLSFILNKSRPYLKLASRLGLSSLSLCLWRRGSRGPSLDNLKMFFTPKQHFLVQVFNKKFLFEKTNRSKQQKRKTSPTFAANRSISSFSMRSKRTICSNATKKVSQSLIRN